MWLLKVAQIKAENVPIPPGYDVKAEDVNMEDEDDDDDDEDDMEEIS